MYIETRGVPCGAWRTLQRKLRRKVLRRDCSTLVEDFAACFSCQLTRSAGALLDAVFSVEAGGTFLGPQCLQGPPEQGGPGGPVQCWKKAHQDSWSMPESCESANHLLQKASRLYVPSASMKRYDASGCTIEAQTLHRPCCRQLPRTQPAGS